jgi:hypothetical protein
MKETDIKALFSSVIEERGIYNKLTGISEDKIYNWRKGRGAAPSIGDMLEVLFQLNLISISKNG